MPFAVPESEGTISQIDGVQFAADQLIPCPFTLLLIGHETPIPSLFSFIIGFLDTGAGAWEHSVQVDRPIDSFGLLVRCTVAYVNIPILSCSSFIISFIDKFDYSGQGNMQLFTASPALISDIRSILLPCELFKYFEYSLASRFAAQILPQIKNTSTSKSHP